MTQNEIIKEYRRVRKNIRNRNYRARKAGRTEIALPQIPKKITSGSIRKLERKVASFEKKKKRKTPVSPFPVSIVEITNDRLLDLINWISNQISNSSIKSEFNGIATHLKHLVLSADKEETLIYGKRYKEKQKEIESVVNKYKDTNNIVGLSKLFKTINEIFDTSYQVLVDKEAMLDLATGEVIEI